MGGSFRWAALAARLEPAPPALRKRWSGYAPLGDRSPRHGNLRGYGGLRRGRRCDVQPPRSHALALLGELAERLGVVLEHPGMCLGEPPCARLRRRGLTRGT